MNIRALTSRKTIYFVFLVKLLFYTSSLQSAVPLKYSVANTDLELRLESANTSPSAYSFFTATFTLENKGTEMASDILVAVPIPVMTVFQGGNEAEASQGVFIPYGKPTWIVGSIAAGDQATLQVNFYNLGDTPKTVYGQVMQQSPLDADSSPGNGTPPVAVEDDEAALAINGIGGKADLSIMLRDAPSFLVAGNPFYFIWQAANFGAEASGSFSVKSILSRDRVVSSDDISLNTQYIFNLEAGENSSIYNVAANVPFDIDPTGRYFILIQADSNGEVDESDENNNIYPQPIHVVGLESPSECTYVAGNGQILCTDVKANGDVDAYLLDQGTINQVSLDRDGNTIASQNLGVLSYDSLLINDNQLIKKQADGTIVWQRSIPSAVRTLAPVLEAATELNDGSIILGGFQKLSIIPGSPFDIDSLVLVKTDANLNIQSSSIAIRNSRNIRDDKLHHLIAHPDGGFTAVYTIYYQSIIATPLLSFRKVSANFDYGNFNTFPSHIFNDFIQTPCGDYYLDTEIFQISQKSNFRGKGIYTYDPRNLKVINQRRVGNGNIDRFGPYRTYSFNSSSPDSLIGGFSLLRDSDPYPPFKMLIVQPNGAKDSVETAFFPFTHIVATSSSSVLILREKAGEVLAFNPECNPAPEETICFDKSYTIRNTFSFFINTIEKNAAYDLFRGRTSRNFDTIRTRFDELTTDKAGELINYNDAAPPLTLGIFNKTNDGNYSVVRVDNKQLIFEKRDLNETLIWSRSIPVQVGDFLRMEEEVVQNEAGEYFITGIALTNNPNGPPPYAIFVIKTDALGNVIWQFEETVEELEGATSNFDLNPSRLKPDGTGGCGLFLYRNINDTEWLLNLDGNGQKRWFRQVGGIGTLEFDFATTENGALFNVTGDFIRGTLYDSAGNSLWSINQTDMGLLADRAVTTATSDGGFVMVVQGDSIPPNGKDRLFIVKVDGNGNLLWVKFLKDLTNINTTFFRLYGLQETSDKGFLLTSSYNSVVLLIKTDENGELCFDPPTFTCTNNLVPNSGFEDASPLSGWLNLAGAEVTNDAYSGDNAILVCGQAFGGAIRAIPVTVNQKYTLRAFTKRSGTGNNFTSLGYKFLTDQWQPLSNGASFSIVNASYEEFVEEINVPATAAYIELRAIKQAGNACLYVDDWCLTEDDTDECLNDMELPVISGCPNDIQQTITGTSATASWVPPTASDNCGLSDYRATAGPNATQFPLGTTTVTYTAVDFAGNEATCSFNITLTQQSGDKADLRLANLSAPATVIAGTIPAYQFDLINEGTVTASGAYVIGVWLSQDPNISNDDLYVGFVNTGNTPVGTISAVPGTIDIPANTSAGNYYLILQADSDNDIDESNENNNILSTTIAVEEDDGGIPDCLATSNFPWEDWISGVQLGSSLDQASGKSSYSDFTAIAYDVEKGTPLALQLTATFSYQTYDEYWRVWIDLDQDQVLEASELLYEGIMTKRAAGSGVSYSQQTNLTIPATALNGNTKMRVIMSRNEYAAACGEIDFGEVEDYTLNIMGNRPPAPSLFQRPAKHPSFRIFPNPAADYALLDLSAFDGEAVQIAVYDQLGKVRWQKVYEAAPERELLELGTWMNGTYTVWVKPKEGKAQVERMVLINTY